MEEEFSGLKSDEQWQQAVDAAYTFLLLAEAIDHGLISGDPETGIDVERCRRALEAGRARGIEPSAAAVDDWAGVLRGEGFKTKKGARRKLLEILARPRQSGL